MGGDVSTTGTLIEPGMIAFVVVFVFGLAAGLVLLILSQRRARPSETAGWDYEQLKALVATERLPAMLVSMQIFDGQLAVLPTNRQEILPAKKHCLLTNTQPMLLPQRV